MQQLVYGGGLGEKMQKLNRGNLEAEFPPLIRGPSPEQKREVAAETVQINVNNLRDWIQGCCRSNYVPFVKPLFEWDIQEGRILRTFAVFCS